MRKKYTSRNSLILLDIKAELRLPPLHFRRFAYGLVDAARYSRNASDVE